MAAALRIGTLTDELIAIIANIQDKTVAQNIVKRNAAGRVDQFEVSRRLDGLQEKFQIVGNAGLADAVRLRLSELDAKKCHWAPEVLFLLLELSDKPASKSGPDRVELFKPPDPPPILVWSDLGTSDLDKEDIWDDIDYANDSSDENLSLASSDISIPRIIPQSSKVPLDEYIPPEDIYLTVEDDGLVSSIQNTQAWRYLPSSLPESSNGILTDLQVMREVIFMLEGLPNSLFRNLNDSIEIDDRFFVQHASREAFRSILRSFSDLGVCIQRLRAFGKQPQEVPFMQMFQKEVDKLVYDLDSFLSETEARYSVKPQLPCASLLELFDDVRKETKLLVELAGLVKRLKRTTGQNGFLCLDLLYDLVCAKQAAAEDAEYKVMAKIFFKCFEIYAKPIQLWMKTGMLDESLGSFFIKTSGRSTHLKSLWHEWFSLEEFSGQLYGPKFLRPAADKIFTTGKSMIFLRNLGVAPETLNLETPKIDKKDIFPVEIPSAFVPFSGFLQGAFGRLVNENHSVASAVLRAELNEKCGLWLSMQALDYIYLGKDTALLMAVDQRIFELIDKGRQSWNDRFLLTESFQQALGNLSCIDVSRLIARTIKVAPREFEKHCRSVKLLKALSVDYVLPWPVANVISKQSMNVYQRLSTFLMQIRRAKYVLEKQCSNKPRYLRHDTYTEDDILSFAIRHYLLWFVNILYYHFTELVISSSRSEMVKSMAEAKDVDGMISVHQSFISSMEEQCLLSKNLAPIYQAVISILDLCLQFSDIQVGRYAEYQYDQANQSTTYLHLNSSRYRRGRRSASEEDDEELSSDEDEGDYINQTMFGDGSSTCMSFAELSYRERLLGVKQKSDELSRFVKTGLRGIGRVDGRNSWAMLADRLEPKSHTFM
ncbi:Spc97 / Spc98 family protein [Coccidioides posadasii C735 delta SOWgp]|uniref:Spindle pole body component n=1 Tax=Coccidioides posadasii (strain C735) TaxID=222929 RepID=C5P4I6_COCP7|nr:Spc97 / Spc98 family protein [Coccidioides posadasii C735 delta SOWgp]EER27626.1 Spc97 / Spc98 family protein [Coccidioides posadasii C735 delta SOWgp]|eukprot:XP_003069771.1 Spc97 / Spc98 family protein [Coccidioides posadasii C735 delta SOWgp]